MSCTAVLWTQNVIQILSLLGPAVFAALRIYALGGRSKILCAVTFVLSLVPFLQKAADAYHYPAVNEPPPIGCTYGDSYSVQLQIVTLKTLQATQDSEQPSLHRVLLQNGSVYFCVLLSLNIISITLDMLQLTFPNSVGEGSYVAQYIDPIITVLTSRFLLDLRAADEKLSSGGAGSSVSAGSLEFAGADILSGEVQPFWDLEEDPEAREDGDEGDDANGDVEDKDTGSGVAVVDTEIGALETVQA
ncbi:hypothetical protein OH77DRAFT_1524361 [Trametes cingulata]|nr:hypothetical protein OH77DRAFT_1524361 [Trametes cingulata]